MAKRGITAAIRAIFSSKQSPSPTSSSAYDTDGSSYSYEQPIPPTTNVDTDRVLPPSPDPKPHTNSARTTSAVETRPRNLHPSDVEAASQDTLRQMCRNLKQPHTGTKNQLRQRVRNLSRASEYNDETQHLTCSPAPDISPPPPGVTTSTFRNMPPPVADNILVAKSIPVSTTVPPIPFLKRLSSNNPSHPPTESVDARGPHSNPPPPHPPASSPSLPPTMPNSRPPHTPNLPRPTPRQGNGFATPRDIVRTFHRHSARLSTPPTPAPTNPNHPLPGSAFTAPIGTLGRRRRRHSLGDSEHQQPDDTMTGLASFRPRRPVSTITAGLPVDLRASLSNTAPTQTPRKKRRVEIEQPPVMPPSAVRILASLERIQSENRARGVRRRPADPLPLPPSVKRARLHGRFSPVVNPPPSSTPRQTVHPVPLSAVAEKIFPPSLIPPDSANPKHSRALLDPNIDSSNSFPDPVQKVTIPHKPFPRSPVDDSKPPHSDDRFPTPEQPIRASEEDQRPPHKIVSPTHLPDKTPEQVFHFTLPKPLPKSEPAPLPDSNPLFSIKAPKDLQSSFDTKSDKPPSQNPILLDGDDESVQTSKLPSLPIVSKPITQPEQKVDKLAVFTALIPPPQEEKPPVVTPVEIKLSPPLPKPPSPVPPPPKLSKNDSLSTSGPDTKDPSPPPAFLDTAQQKPLESTPSKPDKAAPIIPISFDSKLPPTTAFELPKKAAKVEDEKPNPFASAVVKPLVFAPKVPEKSVEAPEATPFGGTMPLTEKETPTEEEKPTGFAFAKPLPVGTLGKSPSPFAAPAAPDVKEVSVAPPAKPVEEEKKPSADLFNLAAKPPISAKPFEEKEEAAPKPEPTSTKSAFASQPSIFPSNNGGTQATGKPFVFGASVAAETKPSDAMATGATPPNKNDPFGSSKEATPFSSAALPSTTSKPIFSQPMPAFGAAPSTATPNSSNALAAQSKPMFSFSASKDKVEKPSGGPFSGPSFTPQFSAPTGGSVFVFGASSSSPAMGGANTAGPITATEQGTKPNPFQSSFGSTAFGASQKAPANKPGPNTTPAFGGVMGNPTPSPFPSSPFQGFGSKASGPAPSAVPMFGAMSSSATQSTFGAAAVTTPGVFGAPPNSGPSFGASPSPFGAPSFGAAPNTAGGFGGAPTNTFGAPPRSTPVAFGTPAASAPAFGATPTSAPAFGAPPNSGPAFGAAPTSAPAFGAAPPTAGPAFGSGAAFGGTPGSGPMFGAPQGQGGGGGGGAGVFNIGTQQQAPGRRRQRHLKGRRTLK